MSSTPSGSARMRMLGLLAGLPEPADARFPQAIRRVLEGAPDLEPVLHGILNEKSTRSRVRFAALYGLLLRMRREERYGEYAALVARWEAEFGSQPYYQTFRAIIAQMRGDLASLRSAVEFSRQAAILMPDVPGVVHQLAAFWVEYLERLETPTRQDLDAVERHADTAIARSHASVAHYFETKGRVLALRGEFEAARAAVAHAIELEPRTARDYLRRLTQYQTTRLRIDLLEERARWTDSHERFRTELVDFKAQQLQLLGLLAAVVAFIATASNIAGQVRGPDAIRLMLVASGAMAVVFGTFSLVNNARLARVAAAALIGAVLIGIGLFVPATWPA